MEQSVIEATEFNQVAAPLLVLLRQLTGLETTFLTMVDVQLQRQWVISSQSAAELPVPSGTMVPWQQSICYLMSEQQLCQTSELGQLFPQTFGVSLGMRSFFVLPVTMHGELIGTLCGADRQSVQLSRQQIDQAELIAQALSSQLKLLLDNYQYRCRLQHQQREASQLRAQVDDLAEQASTDALTGLPNRRAFEQHFAGTLLQAAQRQQEIGLIRLDIDHFKQFNDRFGHDSADQVLQLVGRALLTLARASDMPCRFGGDEFQLASIGTSAAGLQTLALRLQQYLQQHPVQPAIRCTVSIGIATTALVPLETLYQAADQALYQAKAAGRNCIRLWQPEQEVR